jgi:hypothetical protein
MINNSKMKSFRGVKRIIEIIKIIILRFFNIENYWSIINNKENSYCKLKNRKIKMKI